MITYLSTFVCQLSANAATLWWELNRKPAIIYNACFLWISVSMVGFLVDFVLYLLAQVGFCFSPSISVYFHVLSVLCLISCDLGIHAAYTTVSLPLSYPFLIFPLSCFSSYSLSRNLSRAVSPDDLMFVYWIYLHNYLVVSRGSRYELEKGGFVSFVLKGQDSVLCSAVDEYTSWHDFVSVGCTRLNTLVKAESKNLNCVQYALYLQFQWFLSWTCVCFCLD